MDKIKAPLVGAFLLEYAGDVSYISDHFFIIDKYTADDKVVFDEAVSGWSNERTGRPRAWFKPIRDSLTQLN